MNINRREFLGNSLQAGAVVSLAPAIPALLTEAAARQTDARGDSILVVVQLSGGNDGLNTVVPYEDDAYYKNRFTIAIGKGAVQKLDDGLGLHPSMSGLASLYKDGKMAVVQGIGYPNPNRSHFESMDLWHTAHRSSEQRQAGWIGRYLDALAGRRGSDLPAVHFGSEEQPLALAGQRVRVPSLKSLREFRLDARRDRQVAKSIEQVTSASRPAASDLLGFVQRSTESALAASRRLEQSAGKLKSTAEYPSTNLARKLDSISKLINAGLSTRVYYVTLNGFDTHANQAGAHAGLLNELSSAISAFFGDLAKRGQDKRVMLMAFSEFGRRLKENASRGTDHGAAAPMLVVGGRAKGGIVGKHPSLTDLTDGDPKFHTDYRQVYATMLEDWLGWEAKDILGGNYKKLPFIS